MSIEKLLWSHDATGLAELVRKGDIEPRELVDAAIARAEKVNPEINAIAEPLFERARALALKVDRSAPFAGVPTTLKDIIIEMEGVPVYAGSRVAPHIASRSSVLTERYLAAGLVPIATTTLSEQGLRLMTESQAFGTTRNPWDTERTSGGSSGGAASITAAGVVPVSHAADGGGSIRVPAACTGLVGLKPTRGRVPLTPAHSELWFGFTVQHAITRSVRDSAALLDLSSTADPLSPYAAPPPRRTFREAASREPGRLRIGVQRASPLGLPVSKETNAALEAAATLAREGGHAVEDIDLPFLDRAFMGDFARLVCVSTAGIMRAEAERLNKSILGELERSTRVVARLGDILSGGEASAMKARLEAASLRLLEETARYDAVLMPLISHPPLPVGAMVPKGLDNVLEEVLDRLRLTRLLRIEALFGQLMDKSLWFTHWPAIQNVTGQPAIALPVHMTAEGLPLGIQAVGRMGDEETLLSLAAQMERQSGWLDRRAPMMVPEG
jgi:amidase